MVQVNAFRAGAQNSVDPTLLQDIAMPGGMRLEPFARGAETRDHTTRFHLAGGMFRLPRKE